MAKCALVECCATGLVTQQAAGRLWKPALNTLILPWQKHGDTPFANAMWPAACAPLGRLATVLALLSFAAGAIDMEARCFLSPSPPCSCTQPPCTCTLPSVPSGQLDSYYPYPRPSSMPVSLMYLNGLLSGSVCGDLANFGCVTRIDTQARQRLR